jgi:hypothetical protein
MKNKTEIIIDILNTLLASDYIDKAIVKLCNIIDVVISQENLQRSEPSPCPFVQEPPSHEATSA